MCSLHRRVLRHTAQTGPLFVALAVVGEVVLGLWAPPAGAAPPDAATISSAILRRRWVSGDQPGVDYSSRVRPPSASNSR